MMLGEEGGVHAEGFGELGLGDGFVDRLVVGGGVAGFVKEENAEAHAGLLGRFMPGVCGMQERGRDGVVAGARRRGAGAV